MAWGGTVAGWMDMGFSHPCNHPLFNLNITQDPNFQVKGRVRVRVWVSVRVRVSVRITVVRVTVRVRVRVSVKVGVPFRV